MEKIDLAMQFSLRLKEAMLRANFSSKRSTSGICIHKLAEITGFSLQICRRYLSGQAIPEPPTLMEIAKQLSVSSGWLLFGDVPSQSVSDDNMVISKSILIYIFSKTASLYNTNRKAEELSFFILKLIEDVSQISYNEEQAKKIIDLALASINHFTADSLKVMDMQAGNL